MVRARLRYKYIVAIVFVTRAVHGHHGHDDRQRRPARRSAAEFDASAAVDRVGRARLPAVAWPCGSRRRAGSATASAPRRRSCSRSAMFTVASALCGQAHSLDELIAFRVLQGVGGGMLTPVGTAMLFRAFPPIERAKASTVLIIPTVLAPALGPDHRRLARHRRVVALDLLRQRARRHRRLRLRRALPPRAPRADRRAASTSPGFVLSRRAASRSCSTRCREGPMKGWRSPRSSLDRRRSASLLFALLVVVETARPAEPMLALRLFARSHVPQRQHRRVAHLRQLRSACCSSCRCSCRTCAASRRSSPGSRRSPRRSA